MNTTHRRQYFPESRYEFKHRSVIHILGFVNNLIPHKERYKKYYSSCQKYVPIVYEKVLDIFQSLCHVAYHGTATTQTQSKQCHYTRA